MNRNRKKVLISVIVVFALICVGACGFLVDKAVMTLKAKDDYMELVAAATASNTEITKPSVNVDVTENPFDIAALEEENPDIYSWLYVPDTNISYPVLQSADSDNFYLDHDYLKDYSFPGAIYSQSVNSKDWSDRVTVLYGHNMLDGSMFAHLHRFEDADYFNENPYFYIYTENRKLTYEIVSAFLYDDRHILNSFDFSKDEVFKAWLEQAQNPRSVSANVNHGVQLNLNSKLVVLSTCPNYQAGRYLVQGVLIKDEPTQ